MDRIDRKILACLQQDATLSVAQVADRVGLRHRTTATPEATTGPRMSRVRLGPSKRRKTMSMNTMKVGDYDAVVRYDPEIEMFRGEFIGLNGGADFYAVDVESLKNEADISLQVFLETCEEKGIEPVKNYSGKCLKVCGRPKAPYQLISYQ